MFRRAALEERMLTDYVAAVLLAFSRIGQLHSPGAEASPNFAYVCDLVARLETCPPEQAYLLRTHLANYTLFLSGLFAERVHAHARRRGAPGLGFYEAVGRSSYLSSARHPHARRTDLGAIFELLGSEFHRVRVALNDLADTLLHFHLEPSLIRAP